MVFLHIHRVVKGANRTTLSIFVRRAFPPEGRFTSMGTKRITRDLKVRRVRPAEPRRLCVAGTPQRIFRVITVLLVALQQHGTTHTL